VSDASDGFVFEPPNLGRYRNLLNPDLGCNWREVADLFGLMVRESNLGNWFVTTPSDGAIALNVALKREFHLEGIRGTNCWYAPDEAATLAAVRRFHSIHPGASRDEVLAVVPTLAMLRSL
jgi:hypothetical protein